MARAPPAAGWRAGGPIDSVCNAEGGWVPIRSVRPIHTTAFGLRPPAREHAQADRGGRWRSHPHHEDTPMAKQAKTGKSERPETFGELRGSGYRQRSVREELRENLMRKLEADAPLFEGIVGYDQTVIPQLENAILAGHDVILLGERGQA